MEFFKHPLFEKHNLALKKEELKPYSQMVYQRKKLISKSPLRNVFKKGLDQKQKKNIIKSSQKSKRDRYVLSSNHIRKPSKFHLERESNLGSQEMRIIDFTSLKNSVNPRDSKGVRSRKKSVNIENEMNQVILYYLIL